MRVNYLTHACWLIAVLIAVIAFLLLRITNGGEVNAYISFASSIASLILAIVAIFYSIVSNSSLSESLSSVKNIGTLLSGYTDKLNEAGERFSSKVDSISPHLSSIPSTLELMNDHLEQSLQGRSTSQTTSPVESAGLADDKGSGRYFEKAVTTGVNMAVYIVAKAHKEEIEIDLEEILKGPVLQNYVFGALSTLEATAYRGLSIALVKGSIAVFSPGELDSALVIKKAESRTDEVWKDLVSKINEYITAKSVSVDQA